MAPSRAPLEVARRNGTKTSAFPILPATAAAFLLLGLAQLTFWWWEARLPDSGLPGEPKAQRSNPFAVLSEPNPTAVRAVETGHAGEVREAQRLVAAPLPQNLQFGDALGGVTVTIFTDPACGPCRAKVQHWLAGLPIQGVRQVYKFWPQDPARLTPGMLLELARRQGPALLPFWHSLQGAGDADLDDEKLLTMLDRAGLPLTEQRNALTDNGPQLLNVLEPDIMLAQDAHLPPPPVLVVDDYVLDGQVLNPNNLNAYVKKRMAGRQILENEDLWLMRK